MSYDGIVSRTLNRPLSGPIARALTRTPVTPNAVTASTLVLAAITCFLTAIGLNIVGGIGIQVVSVVDGVDGELARLKNRATAFGAVFDAVTDRYADALMLGGMTIYAVRFESHWHAAAIGMLAIGGALIVSYSRARIEASMGAEAAESGNADLVFGLASRDVRSLVAAIGTIAGQCYITLIILAVMTGITIVWRLAYLRVRTGKAERAQSEEQRGKSGNQPVL